MNPARAFGPAPSLRATGRATEFTFWQSTNGKKVVMAVTGVMMFGFVVGHMLGNLQMFEAPEHINAYGHFLHNLGEILWLERGVLLLAIALHIIATIRLRSAAKLPDRSEYSRRQAINSSYASRTMYWSGPIVLAFIIFHLLQFTAGLHIHPQSQFIAGDDYHNVVAGFQVWWVSAWYIFAMCLLGLHLSHGLWSMFQSVGLGHPRLTPYLKVAAKAIAIIIVLGYISIPISVLLGFIK